MAHLAFVRSPHASARITAIRVPESAPGLLAVITPDDLEGRVRPFPLLPYIGAELSDDGHPVLDLDARYVGQPVVAVVAESRALAEDAAELVEVDYEIGQPVLDARSSDHVMLRWAKSQGDVDGGFAAAAHVVRGTYSLPRLAAVPMETRGTLADYDRATDELTLWISAQDPHRPLAQAAHVLGRPQDRVRIVVPEVGGAFGSKGGIAPEGIVAAIAAMDLGRPVKWAEDRLENFLASYQGRGMEADVELAFDADGRMLALRSRLFADLGAYLYTNSTAPPPTAAMLMTGCYAVPAADVVMLGTRTNKVPTGPYRGAGRPEAAYFLECTVDQAAREIGIDPVELRRRNLVTEFPYRTPLGFSYDSGDYERCLDLAVEKIRAEHSADEDRLVGTGMAMYVERGGGTWESAEATVSPAGRVIVRSGVSPHGQGHETTFAQIAADRLGIEPDDIVLRFGDTAIVPRGIGTFASRSVAMGGSAMILALDRIREKMLRLAAHLLEADAEAVEWDGSAVVGPEDRRVSFKDIAAAAYRPERLPPGMEPGLDAGGRFASDQVFASGAYGAVVEIERATGRMRVLRISAVDDAGTIINPLLAEGQVIGGVAQGLGECLVEEILHDEDGQQLTASFADYSLVTAAEMPPIVTALPETPSPRNPLGAKGIGEGGTIGTLPAIANAVADALGGRHLDPPYTAEKLWRALQEGAA
jgi:carbon-monoxide dehydrogenase large subunit